MAENVELVKIEDIGGRQHPDYKTKLDLWNFLLASCRGGMGMQQRFTTSSDRAKDLKPSGYFAGLFRWPQETDIHYNIRTAETPYTPYARRIVKSFVNYITKDEPTRKGSGIDLDFLKDVDRKHHNMKDFVRSALSNQLVLGNFNILIDVPRVNVKIKSKADQIALGIKPYCVPVLPQNIVDWSLDEFGRYEWLIIERNYTVNNITEEKARVETTRSFWNKECCQQYTKTDNKWVFDFTKIHPCGEVPIIRATADDIDNSADTAETWFYDLADMNRFIYNIKSLVTTAAPTQMIPQTIVPESMGEQLEKQSLTLSEHKAWTEQPDEQGITRYMQTTGNEYTAMREIEADMRQEMYRVSGLFHRTDSRMAESGEAKAWDHMEMNQFLAAAGDMADFIDTEILRVKGLWEGKRDSKVSVEYTKNYNVADVAELMAAVLDLSTVDFPSEVGRKEIMKKVHRVLLESDISEDVMKAIEDEIEKSVKPDPLKDFNTPPTDGDNTGQDS